MVRSLWQNPKWSKSNKKKPKLCLNHSRRVLSLFNKTVNHSWTLISSDCSISKMTSLVNKFSKSISKRLMMTRKWLVVGQETVATDSLSQVASFLSIKLSSLTPTFLTTKYSNLSSGTLRQIFANLWCLRLQKWNRKMDSLIPLKSYWFSWLMCQTRFSTTSRRQNNHLSL